MADINKTVAVSYSADVSDLMKEIKRIPGITKKQAEQMSTVLTKHLKQSEAATKKAAVTADKSFKKMEKSAKKAGNEYRKLKRTSSEMGRGLGEVAMLVGESDSALGAMANQASGLAMTGAALTPLMIGLGGAIKGLGLAAGAAATGGLAILVTGIGMLVSSHMSAEEAQEKNKKKLAELNKAYEKYNKLVEKAKIRSEQLAKKVIDARDAIANLQDQVELERLQIAAEIDPVFIEDLEGLEKKIAFKEIERRAKNSFEKVNSTLSESLGNQADLVENARKRVNTILGQGRVSQRLIDDIGVVTPDDFARIEEYFDKIKKGQQVTRKIGGTTVVLSLGEEDLKNTEHLLKNLKEFSEQNQILKKLEAERLQFQQTRVRSEEELVASMKENFIEQKKLEKSKEKSERSSIRSTAASGEENKIISMRNQLKALENKLSEESLSDGEKKLLQIDKEIEKLESMWELSHEIFKNEEEQFDVSKAMTQLLEKRAKIEESIQTKKNLENQKQLQQKILDDTKFEIKLYRELFEDRKLGFEELNDLRFKYQGSFLENEQRIHAEILQMIEERNQKTKEGIQFLANATGQFGDSMMRTLENVGSKNAELIAGLFALQQASSISQIAFSTAENITKAQGFPPPLNIAGIAAAVAVGAAQTAAVMSQSPPRMHMGGMLGPDEQNVTLLKGESVLDRTATRKLGEEGVRKIQEGRTSPEVIVLQPFKHFDRYLRGRDRRKRKSANRGY